MTNSSDRPPSTAKKHTPSAQEKKHTEELLDEALDETFPASDPPAMLEPAHKSKRTNGKK